MSYQHANKSSLKWRTRVVWHDITHINWSRHTDECFICNTCYIYASRCVMSRSSCSVGCIHTPRRVKLNESFVWETRLIQIRWLKLQDSLIICICRCIDICRCFDSFVCRCTCIWYMCVGAHVYGTCVYIDIHTVCILGSVHICTPMCICIYVRTDTGVWAAPH